MTKKYFRGLGKMSKFQNTDSVQNVEVTEINLPTHKSSSRRIAKLKLCPDPLILAHYMPKQDFPLIASMHFV